MIQLYQDLWRKLVTVLSTVTWPGPKQVWWAAFTVIALSVIIGAYLLLLDSAFYAIRNSLIN